MTSRRDPALSEDDRLRRILHVCEAFDGGVASAVHAVIARVPKAEHTVLLVPHRERLGPTERREGVSYIDADGFVPAFRALRRIASTYRELAPDVVHAHSSYAGVYVRSLLRIPRSKIVYSPHCFAFERDDAGRVGRALYRAVERALVPRTGILAAFSRREADLARALSSRLRVIETTYVPDVPADLLGSACPPGPGEPLVVSASGRLSQQKDPSYFAEVVRLTRASGVDARWIWIGDGEQEFRHELEALGVEITGWQDRNAVLAILASSNVLLHTAGWETGVPIAILEAAALGVPVVARSIRSMGDFSVGELITSPQEAAEALARLRASAHWRAQAGLVRAALGVLMEQRDVASTLMAAYRIDD